MQALRRRRFALCWIALVAVLAGVLLPSFSMGMAGGARLAWMEVCTALGAQRVPVPADLAGPELVASGQASGQASAVSTYGVADDGPAAPQHASLDHCPWCTVGAHGALPPAPAPDAGPPPARQDPPVVGEADVARPARHVCSAQPRAPPLLT